MTDRMDELFAPLRQVDNALPPLPVVRARGTVIRRRRTAAITGAVAAVVAAAVAVPLAVTAGHRDRSAPPIAPPTVAVSPPVTAPSLLPSLSPAPVPSAESSPPATPSLNATGVVLADGTRLPAGCVAPSTQAQAPAADESFIAYDDCGTGQFSFIGKPLRYLSALQGQRRAVAPNGAIVTIVSKAEGDCGIHQELSVLLPSAAAATYAGDVVGGGRGDAPSSVIAIAASGTSTAWVSAGCSDFPTVQRITVVGAGARRLAYQGVAPAMVVNGLAVDATGRLAISVSNVKVAPCPVGTQGVCHDVTSEGIAIVGTTETAVPLPTIVPSIGCHFGTVNWSGADIVTVESCSDGEGLVLSRVVTASADSGARMLAVPLPNGLQAFGLRVLSNGDALVPASRGEAAIETLLRVHGSVATELPLLACQSCTRAAVSILP